MNVSVPTRDALALVKSHPVISMFVLAYTLTWLIEIPLVAGARHLLPLQPSSPVGSVLQLLDGWMPGLAAIVVSGVVGGRKTVNSLLARILIWRVGVQWYLLAAFGVIPLWIAALALDPRLGGSGFKLPVLSGTLVAGGVGAFLQFLIFNSEELAWRGFAITRLQARYSALVASLIVGPVWAVFHLPFFFIPGGLQAAIGFPSFLIQLIALSVIFTWLFNSTRGSVLLCMILHASQNTWTTVFAPSSADVTVSGWIYTATIVIAAIVLVAVFGMARLSRTPASELPVVIDR